MPPKQAALHPCITQHGRCHYGSFCAFKELPGNSCLFFLQQQVTPSNPPCRFGAGCSNSHHQIRKRGDVWVIQPPQTATYVPPPVQKPKLVPNPSPVQTTPPRIIKPEKTKLETMTEQLNELSIRDLEKLISSGITLLQQKKGEEEDVFCSICFTGPKMWAPVQCGHRCMCTECLGKLTEKKCPLCRAPFEKAIKIF